MTDTYDFDAIQDLLGDLRALYQAHTIATRAELTPGVPPKEWELRHTDADLVHEALLEVLLTRIRQLDLSALVLTRLERALKSQAGRRAVKDQAVIRRRAEKTKS